MSSNLWAQPSKEWVIPARPKPGRKPKKDEGLVLQQTIIAQVEDEQVKKAQNRVAQRAFRERKQSQISELQAKINAYEQGEITKNVELQALGKKLKEENKQLREENSALKGEVARLGRQQALMSAMNLTDGGEKKRSASPIPEYRDIRKKTKHTHELIPLDMASPSEQTYGAALSPVTSSSYVSTPPTLSPPESAQTEPNFDSFYIPSDNTSELRLHDPVAIVDCGFCSNGNPCVCRAFAAQSSSSQAKISVEEPMSPLDALPPFQPAVPLPRRRRNPAQAQPLFPLMSLSANPPTSSEAPVCSGDPSNCAACADDPLGQAFCEALGNSSKCDGCPSRGEGSGCSREDSSNSTQPRNVSQSLSLETGGTDTNEQEAIPCSSAWAQLKSHPNIQFADLSLLADVVARRSKCAGPSVVISPAPGTVTPERSISPRPRLVPQEILVQCGRQRVLQVQAEGVREALAVLDRSAPL